MSSFQLHRSRAIVEQPALEQPIRTRYTTLLLQVDRIPWTHTFMAAIFHWLLLAGYLVVPGTFTSLQRSTALKNTPSAVIRTVQNPPLIAISCLFLVIGASGMSWLAWRWRWNCIWLSRLFQPTLLNAVAGLITTLVNVYTSKEGNWSIMALLTVIVTAFTAIMSLAAIIWFRFWMVENIKREHDEIMRELARNRWRSAMDIS